MTYNVIMAGFGGQGVMAMGTTLAYAGMMDKKKVIWLPSYGPEMRGGTANCSVIVADEEIGSPIVVEPDVLVVMNKPALIKFEECVKPGGIIFVNSSLIDIEPKRKDVRVVKVPANDIASELGNPRTLNMVMLGAIIKASNIVSFDGVVKSLKKTFGEKRPQLIPINEEALKRGAECVSLESIGA